MEVVTLADFLKKGSFHTRRKGQAIEAFSDKLRVSYIRKGYVRRFLITKEGTLGAQSIYGPGNFFPLTAAFLSLLNQSIYDGDETYFYEAYTDVQYYTVDGAALAAAAEANPVFYKDILREAGRRLESNIQLLENISLKTPSRRVAHQLVFLAGRYGEKTAKGTTINLPLSHQSISEMLNLNRETISRSMVKLAHKGLIVNNRNLVTVTDSAGLKAIYQ